MSLPLKAVDRIFERLTTTYGRDFTARWEGVKETVVKASWSHELSGFTNHLEAIGWALENLSERAPNVIEFRNICRRAPQVEPLRIDPPKVDPQIVRMVMQNLSAPMVAPDRFDWARAILENPKGRTPTVIAMAKTAVREL